MGHCESSVYEEGKLLNKLLSNKVLFCLNLSHGCKRWEWQELLGRKRRGGTKDEDTSMNTNKAWDTMTLEHITLKHKKQSSRVRKITKAGGFEYWELRAEAGCRHTWRTLPAQSVGQLRSSECTGLNLSV